jgi:hypothetical protein
MSLSSRYFIGAVWLVTVGVGLAVVTNYENAAGKTGQTPSTWPRTASFARDTARPTLVMFAHPKCPCTRASLGELNRLLARCDNRPVTHIFFLKPHAQSDDWARDDLWRNAAGIPGLVLHEDIDGREAERFGAHTSGHVVLYDASGRLQFTGGITAARGHAGDNSGANRVVALLSGQESPVDSQARQTTAVFGCALQETCERSAN